MKGKVSRIATMAALALIAIFGLLVGVNAGENDAYDSSAIQAIDEIAFYIGAAEVSTTTAQYYYGPTANGTTGQNVLWWSEAEVFATIAIDRDYLTETQSVVFTPQFSADGTNWADATWLQQSTIIYDAAATTTTLSVSNGEVTRAIAAMTIDGTKTQNFPLVGKYMRIKMVASSASYGVTPELHVLLKNR